MYRSLIHGAMQVSHHIVALVFVKGVEFLSHTYLARLGADIRNWPIPVLVIVFILVYLVGFASARAIGRRWIRKAVPPADACHPRTIATTFPVASERGATSAAIPPTLPDRTRARSHVKYALAACAIVAVGLGLIPNLRR